MATPKLTRTVLERKIEAINQTVITQMDALAAQWRTEILLPWCRRHKVTVIIGNGSWKFYNQKGEEFDGFEKKFRQINDTLNQSGVGYNDVFGFHVESVQESDLRG
jgi:hypothetical protein